jgi:LmbE family N-acetylglucosaminyl deacetylase
VWLALAFSFVMVLSTVSCAEEASDCRVRVLNVVAHQDDDLLFLSPDLLHNIQNDRCVRTIFVTAGDFNQPRSYWLGREAGVKAAYAAMAGVQDDWNLTDAGVKGHPLPVVTLTQAPKVSLAFMRLPDGGMEGKGSSNQKFASLQKLYLGEMAAIRAVDGSSSYSRDALVQTLVQLIRDYRPDVINTQDYTGRLGDGDHSDHHIVGYLTQRAHRDYAPRHELVGYAGYGISKRRANLSAGERRAKTSFFFTYAVYDRETCATLWACAARPEGLWLARQYTVPS